MPEQRPSEPLPSPTAGKLLTIYLRDHFAGAAAGVNLAERAKKENEGTAWEEVLTWLADQLNQDRRSLKAIMARLTVTPSIFKSSAGRVAEVVGRLKTNGRLLRYSPSSRVVELEALAGGVVTKRNLWRALRSVADTHKLDRHELDALVERADAQYERLLTAHQSAVLEAFGVVKRPPTPTHG